MTRKTGKVFHAASVAERLWRAKKTLRRKVFLGTRIFAELRSRFDRLKALSEAEGMIE